MKYKITIGDKVFDAESNGNGTFQLKNNHRDFTMSAVALDVLGAKIEPVEPMKVEYEGQFPGSSGVGEIVIYTKDLYINIRTTTPKWSGKKVKVTIEELPEPECEHDFTWIAVNSPVQKCTKCGATK